MTAARIAVFACALSVVLSPSSLRAQTLITDTKRATEIGIVQEWFHRELEPAPYNDTEWNITSLQLSYSVTDWLKFAVQGGYSEFENDDFGNSEYKRYSVGGGIAVRAWKKGDWDIEASARYLDTFDLDTSITLLHKHVQSVGGTAQLVRSFSPFGQSAKVWAGPLVVDDRIETFTWDATTALSSSHGTGFGAQAGTRVILGGWVSLYGFASYVDNVQGGVAVSLHARDGAF